MFKNVQFFSHLHLKYAKSAVMTQTFFLEKYQYGYQKTQNFMLISNSLMPAFRNAHKKVKSKKPRKNALKPKYSKFAWFFRFNFF